MTIVTNTISIQSKGEGDIIDITSQVANAIKLANGIVTVFIVGSTAAITTIEYEPGLKHDFPKMLDRIAPKQFQYEHDNTWHDGNGHSHVKASLIGPSITIPFVNGILALGTWQQIVIIEMDTRPRKREIVLQIIGDC